MADEGIRRRQSRKFHLGVGLLALIILLPSGFGFITKLVDFFKTSQSGQEGAFALIPMLVYLSVAAGFLCLLVWAIFQGMFRDIEKPKYTMLENEERLERAAHSLR